MLLYGANHNFIYGMSISHIHRVWMMDNQNEKSPLVQRTLIRAKTEILDAEMPVLSLKDMPLKTRRKEAKKPLFLTRYE